MSRASQNEMKISLLTAGKDKPYVLGLLSGLVSAGMQVDFIGNDEMKNADVVKSPNVNYLNLRGYQNPSADFLTKVVRVIKYYFKLIKYAFQTDSKLFHIQWLNKFIYFDRTVLNIYYKALGKKILYTAHNVNMRKRDGRDSLFNRITLKYMYHVVDGIIVHTENMRKQLTDEFKVEKGKVTIIPFGINNTVPNSGLNREQARKRLILEEHEKILLFFGNIAPYKGLEIAVEAFKSIQKKYDELRLIIAGRIKECQEYWDKITKLINKHGLNGRIINRTEFIPDEEIEIYFKAADALMLPYKFVYQSGPLFLSYNFGLPVIASDVGSFREDIIEGKTGFIYKSEDANDLAKKIDEYFNSDLYINLEANRKKIIEYAFKKYSWDKIGEKTCTLYKKYIEL